MKIVRQDRPVMAGLTILLYGLVKAGKIATAAKFKNPLIVSCEPGGAQFVSGVDVGHVTTLSELLAAKSQILQSPCSTMVIDGLTYLIGRHTASLTDQRDFNKVTNDVVGFLSDLAGSGKVIVATGHAREFAGDGTTKIIGPDLNPALMNDVTGLFSMVLFVELDANGASVISKPTQRSFPDGNRPPIKKKILAGDRSGKLPTTFPLSSLLTLLRNLVKQEDAESTETAETATPQLE